MPLLTAVHVLKVRLMQQLAELHCIGLCIVSVANLMSEFKLCMHSVDLITAGAGCTKSRGAPRHSSGSFRQLLAPGPCHMSLPNLLSPVAHLSLCSRSQGATFFYQRVPAFLSLLWCYKAAPPCLHTEIEFTSHSAS